MKPICQHAEIAEQMALLLVEVRKAMKGHQLKACQSTEINTCLGDNVAKKDALQKGQSGALVHIKKITPNLMWHAKQLTLTPFELQPKS